MGGLDSGLFGVVDRCHIDNHITGVPFGVDPHQDTTRRTRRLMK